MIDHYVCIMPEHGGACCWDESGVAFDIEDLPVSAQLTAELEAWVNCYSEIVEARDEAALDDGDADPLEPIPRLVAFCERGLDLTRRVKAELPAWRVVYWDEAKFETALRVCRDENGGQIPDSAETLLRVRAACQFEVTL